MNKVQIKEGQFLVNGVHVGQFEGTRSEVWVMLKSEKHPHGFAGRFKYNKPKFQATKMIKFLLARCTVDEIVDGMEKSSPLEFAKSKGFDHIKEWGMEKAFRDMAKRMANEPGQTQTEEEIYQSIK